MSSYTTSRERGMNGRYETLPWGGEYRDYEERSGMRIPLEAEVAWWVDGRRAPYWRGRTIRADFDVAAP